MSDKSVTVKELWAAESSAKMLSTQDRVIRKVTNNPKAGGVKTRLYTAPPDRVIEIINWWRKHPHLTNSEQATVDDFIMDIEDAYRHTGFDLATGEIGGGE